MKNYFNVLFAIILFVIAFFISFYLTSNEFSEDPIRTNRVIPSFPTLGFDNFMADTNWIKIIQIKNPQNQKETIEVAEKKYDLLKRITALNPHMNLVYVKAIDLMFVPDVGVMNKALEIFERGSQYNANKKWKIDYCAAFTTARIADRQENEEQKTNYLKRGQHYLKKAEELPNCPPFISRMKAHFLKKMDKPVALVDMWINLYQSASSEYDKQTCYYNLKAVYRDTLETIKKLEKSDKTEDEVLAKKLAKKMEHMGKVLYKDATHCQNIECPYIKTNDTFYVGKEGEKYCPHCGEELQLPAGKIRCPNPSCERIINKTSNYCPYCQTEITVQDEE